MKLCVITAQNERFSHEDMARFAVEGGADCVQFRKKMEQPESSLIPQKG